MGSELRRASWGCGESRLAQDRATASTGPHQGFVSEPGSSRQARQSLALS